MKKLVIPALLLGALQSTGCIFVAGDDDGGDDVAPGDEGNIAASWELVAGDQNTPSGCPAGATTAAIIAQRSGDATPFRDLYNCEDGSGTATDLPLGDYTIWVEITDDNGTTLYARSEAVNATLDLAGETVTANFEINVDHGYFDVSYEFPTATDCTDPDQDGVSVLSTLSGTTEGYDDVFLCTDGLAPNVATTAPLPIGDYTVVVALIDGVGAVLAESDPIQDSIDFGHEFEWLGTDDQAIPLTP